MPDTDIWGADPGAVIVSLVPVLLWVMALVCAGIAILRGSRPITRGFVIDRLLRYLFLFPLGVQGLWAFFCQVFLPEETANAIGWEPSPFQFEVGVANLGLGLASLYAAFSGFGAKAAIAVLAACFLGGAGVGHLIDIAQGDNLAPGNAGPILYTDFLTPIVALVLLLLVPRSGARSVTRSAKIETAPAKVSEKAPHATASSRIEDELETARKSMRESLRAGPRPEVLSPAKPAASNQPRKSPRREKHLPEAQD
jgi:hypothetical protein